jgi:hypothetical protein
MKKLFSNNLGKARKPALGAAGAQRAARSRGARRST